MFVLPMVISIVIPLFNAGELLARAVASVFDTGLAAPDVVIVDDGSTDGSLERAAELASQHPGKVRVFRHPGGVRRGVSASRNLGVAQARGDLIAFLDADDYYYANRFDVSMRILSTDASVDAVYDTADIVCAEPGAATGVLCGGDRFGIRESLTGDDLIRKLLTSQTWPCLGILCRRSLFSRAGLFREDLRIAEDCNLWIRMALVGRLVAGDLEKPVGVYWRHAGNSYEATPENRVEFLRALAYAGHWAATTPGVPPAWVRRVGEALIIQAVRTMIVCRELGRRDLAWRAWRLVLRHGGLRWGSIMPCMRQAQALVREGLGMRVINRP